MLRVDTATADDDARDSHNDTSATTTVLGGLPPSLEISFTIGVDPQAQLRELEPVIQQGLENASVSKATQQGIKGDPLGNANRETMSSCAEQLRTNAEVLRRRLRAKTM